MLTILCLTGKLFLKFFEKQFDIIVEYNNNEIDANAQSFVA